MRHRTCRQVPGNFRIDASGIMVPGNLCIHVDANGVMVPGNRRTDTHQVMVPGNVRIDAYG